MNKDTECAGRKPIQAPIRSERQTLAALANWLAERPWALASVSFTVTAFWIQAGDLSML